MELDAHGVVQRANEACRALGPEVTEGALLAGHPERGDADARCAPGWLRNATSCSSCSKGNGSPAWFELSARWLEGVTTLYLRAARCHSRAPGRARGARRSAALLAAGRQRTGTDRLLRGRAPELQPTPTGSTPRRSAYDPESIIGRTFMLRWWGRRPSDEIQPHVDRLLTAQRGRFLRAQDDRARRLAALDRGELGAAPGQRRLWWARSF